MKYKDIDTLLHVALKSNHKPSDDLNQCLFQRIEIGNDTAKYHFQRSQTENRKKVVSIRGWKKVAVIACVLTMAMGSVGVAGGKLKYMVGLRNSYESDCYEDVDRVIDRIGFEAAIPEQLTDEYEFQHIYIEEIADVDDDGHQYDNRDVLEVVYSSVDDATDINLSISGEDETLKYDMVPHDTEIAEGRSESGYTTSREADGVTIFYYSDTFLFAPEDYTPTAKEQELDEKDPSFYISYGGDEDPYYSHGQTIVFVVNGETYELQTFDSWLSEDEFYEIGEQLLSYVMKN